MKKILYLLFCLLSISSYGQIGDPAPNFDLEWPPPKPGYKWDFSKKPYKKISSDNNMCIDEFDSKGRPILRTVNWDNFIESTLTKYSDDMIVELTTQRIYIVDKNANKTRPDEIKTTKLNVDNKGKIIDGKTFKLTKDGIYKVIGYQYYDKKNRLIKITDSTETYIANYYYSGKNLIRKEEINSINSSTKTVIDRNYKYNNNNQIVSSELTKSIFKNNVLIEKKSHITVKQEYKNNLLVKKVLYYDSETIERNYTYDNNMNLISFIETKKNNSDGMISSQIKRTKKYENNILLYSDYHDGIGTEDSEFSFSYFFYSDDKSLSKAETTNNHRNFQDTYFYNEYGHLIKIITSYPNNSQKEEKYNIEYY